MCVHKPHLNADLRRLYYFRHDLTSNCAKPKLEELAKRGSSKFYNNIINRMEAQENVKVYNKRSSKMIQHFCINDTISALSIHISELCDHLQGATFKLCTFKIFLKQGVAIQLYTGLVPLSYYKLVLSAWMVQILTF